jgi:hypothetical protein
MTVVDWLLDSDPAISWQAMRDLLNKPAGAIAAERARVAREGWGAKLLSLQHQDGRWGDDLANPEWITHWALALLREMGLDPASDEARRAVGRVHDNITWHWWGKRFFEGEVEPCINGRVLAVGAYFGQDMEPLVERLLGEQMADGGWNCEQKNGSTRGSFHSTINVLEGLLEYGCTSGSTAEVSAARERGQDYLLERRLLRRSSNGELIDPAFLQLGYPQGYHYDVLRGLDYLRKAGVQPDERAGEAIDIVASKRGPDGRWLLENRHDVEGDMCLSPTVTELLSEMGEAAGKPSRWITLRALRVLRWAGRLAA